MVLKENESSKRMVLVKGRGIDTGRTVANIIKKEGMYLFSDELRCLYRTNPRH